MFAAFSQGGGFNFPTPIQRLIIKCKTAEARDEIALVCDKLKSQIRDESNSAPACLCDKMPISLLDNKSLKAEMAFNVLKNDEDNSLIIWVKDEEHAFDLLSFIEPFLDGIVSVSMSGVNKFKP